MTPARGWREPILRHFSPEIAAAGRLTVVVDEDALFTDPALLEAISISGFELLPTDDSMALRYAYETGVRARRDAGEKVPHAIILCRRRPVDTAVPWDMLTIARREGRVLAFDIAELFPSLAPAALAGLSRDAFDDLAEAIEVHRPERLGEQGTRDFVLRHVFKVAPELVQRDVDLLRVLLRRHYLGEVWPADLDARFISTVRAGSRFAEWPLERIVPERDTFFRFLEERWPRFVRLTAGLPSDPDEEPLRLAGPPDLPFDHQDVRVYVDTLFLEGRLPPTRVVTAAEVQGSWVAVGVQQDKLTPEDVFERIDRLGRLLADGVPSADASHLAWGAVARRYGEWLAALRISSRSTYDSLSGSAAWRPKLEAAFWDWMLRRYSGLASLPPYPRPIMVHHVPEVMARELRGGRSRVALVVMDGMALSQWSALRTSLSGAEKKFALDEDVVFAWVPSITSISRQALLAGETPLHFPATLGTTQKDEGRWRAFWTRESLPPSAIGHIGHKESDDDPSFVERALEMASRPGMRAIAITCISIDRMVHGAVGGERGLQAQVMHWSDDGHFNTLLRGLLTEGYTVHVTADHGNVPARGVGRPNVGETPEVRGERVLVFAHEALRDQVAATIPGSVSWPGPGLPASYHALLAPPGAAFTTLGAEMIGHGSISIEEIVVPYVRVEDA